MFSIGLCFGIPWIFFNIRWTIWNFNSSFPFNERFQYFLCVLLCLLNSVEYIKFTPHRSCLEVCVVLIKKINLFISPLSVCTLSRISLFFIHDLAGLFFNVSNIFFDYFNLTSLFCYSVSIHKSHTLAISRTFVFMF